MDNTTSKLGERHLHPAWWAGPSSSHLCTHVQGASTGPTIEAANQLLSCLAIVAEIRLGCPTTTRRCGASTNNHGDRGVDFKHLFTFLSAASMGVHAFDKLSIPCIF